MDEAPGDPSLPGRVARVAVDVPALADQRRELEYLTVPGVRVGSIVRVPLHGRRAGGWVVDADATPTPGVRLQPIAKLSGMGPSPELVELSAWAAWRWAGRRTAFLRSASPVGVVRGLPPRPGPVGGTEPRDPDVAGMARDALAAGESVVRLPPGADPVELLEALRLAGPLLVITPDARRLARRLAGVVLVPDGWARAAAGGVTVVGARAAAWAPAPDAGAVVVLDAHDRALVEERAPCWSAWQVAAERARRAGIPCIAVSPCPLVEHLQWGRLVQPSRARERAGWAALEVIDRREDDPRAGLLGDRLVPVLRSATAGRRVVVVLNRKGRARLLACRACGQLAVCEHCGAGVESGTAAEWAPGQAGEPGPAAGAPVLRCRRCRRERPVVCQACGATALRTVRTGVTRLREEVEALARLPTGEVTAEVDALPDTPVLVGTEAVLRRGLGAAVVVFVEFDAELSSGRLRSAEDSLALLALASRAVGGRAGRVVIQTRQPHHPVVQAALHADAGLVAAAELPVRQQLGLPPAAALAVLSGTEAASYSSAVGEQPGIEVIGPARDRWVVRAATHRVLCDALAATSRPAGAGNDRLRVEVDPWDV